MSDRIGILSSQRGYHVTALEEAVRSRGNEPVFYNITRLAGSIGSTPAVHSRGQVLEECRALLVRTIPAGSLEQIVFRMDALHRLEKLGVRVVNSPSGIERTVDKYYTSFLLADAGIRTPKTVVAEDFETAFDACRGMGDVVIKPLFGSEGKGMVRVSDEETAYRVLRAWELHRYIFYVQQYLPHSGQDIRAFVIGSRVAAAMRRFAPGWKTNYSKGAEVRPVMLTPEMEALSVRAAQCIGLDYAGVDLMEAEDGETYVVEVNSIPGWRGLEKISACNIAGQIIDYVLHKTHGRERRESQGLKIL
jgi:RimK family alpha-L-glutamate ligase